MAHYQTHFNHHQRELYQNRRRFRAALAVLFAGLFVVVGVQYRASNASSSVLVRGVVHDSNGTGVANVKLNLCHDGNTVVTNSRGNWWIDMPEKAGFCVRYMGGVPAGASAPVPENNRVSGQTGYENQVAGYNCGNKKLDTVCRAPQLAWDLADDDKFEFRTEMKTAAAPTKRVLGQATYNAGAVLAATDNTAPPVPGSFQATVESGNAVVNLSWDATTDTAGLKGYTIERSIDQNTWEKLADSIQTTSYTDNSAGFGITYYYRLSAVDTSGNASGYTASNATTGDFNASSGGSQEGTTYTSDDNLATVLVPANAVTEDVSCTVSVIGVKGKDIGTTTNEPLVEGPYALVCKTSGATVVTDFLKPVTWSFDLKGKLNGVNSPKPYVYNNGKGDLMNNSAYTSATGILKVGSASSSSAMVLAAKNKGLSPNYIVLILAVGGIMAGIAMLILRKKQKSTYDNYLRSKYYDL